MLGADVPIKHKAVDHGDLMGPASSRHDIDTVVGVFEMIISACLYASQYRASCQFYSGRAAQWQL